MEGGLGYDDGALPPMVPQPSAWCCSSSWPPTDPTAHYSTSDTQTARAGLYMAGVPAGEPDQTSGSSWRSAGCCRPPGQTRRPWSDPCKAGQTSSVEQVAAWPPGSRRGRESAQAGLRPCARHAAARHVRPQQRLGTLPAATTNKPRTGTGESYQLKLFAHLSNWLTHWPLK